MAEHRYLVIDRPDQQQYVLERDEDTVGFAAYHRDGGAITFTHTEVDQDLQEHGLGSRLAAGALDDVRQGSDDRVVAECPFIAGFVGEHPEYQDLLTR